MASSQPNNYNKNDEQILAEENKAYSMRLDGYSYPEIAAHLKVSVQTASNRAHSAMERINESESMNLIQLRSLEVARLDKIFVGLWRDFKDAIDITDPETGRLLRDGILARNQIRDRMLKVIDVRAKLLGLADIPVVVKSEAEDLLNMDLEDDSRDNIESLLLAMSERAVMQGSNQ